MHKSFSDYSNLSAQWCHLNLPLSSPWEWPGETRSHGFSGHGIDLILLEYSHLSTWRVNTLRLRQNSHRRHFQMRFLKWKCMIFDWNFSGDCSWGSNWQYSCIGSDNGLAPNRCQAIIWTNDGIVYWCIYVSLSLNELTRSSPTRSSPKKKRSSPKKKRRFSWIKAKKITSVTPHGERAHCLGWEEIPEM